MITVSGKGKTVFGPNIITDGLVTYYDTGNSKYYTEGTTNRLLNTSWAGDGNNQTGFTKASVLITDENLMYNGYTTHLWSPGTSLNCYLNGSVNLSTTLTSTDWAFSCYIKREDGLPITSLGVYMYFPTSDGSAAGTIENVGNGWYRVSRIRNGTANVLSLIGFNGFVANTKYYLSGVQLETKNHITDYVPKQTSRAGTWFDLSGNKNNADLAYDPTLKTANGGFLSFNASAKKAILATPVGFEYTTVSVFYNRNETDAAANWRTIFGHKTANIHHLISQNSTKYIGSYDPVGGFRNLNYIPPENEWHNLTVVYHSGVDMKLYVDGEYFSTQGLSTYLATNPIGIVGNWASSSYWAGYINAPQIFNRALSADEIKQNYKALKTRYMS